MSCGTGFSLKQKMDNYTMIVCHYCIGEYVLSSYSQGSLLVIIDDYLINNEYSCSLYNTFKIMKAR